MDTLVMAIIEIDSHTGPDRISDNPEAIRKNMAEAKDTSLDSI
tara:strand:- start:718 stop:846 length:129 start_codon:yes stop_codon:yes gene_type:complete